MSITLKCGGTLFEAIDDVVLTCDANGMKLTFAVRAREMTRLAVTPTPNTPLRSRSVIEMYNDTTRAFYGLVYDAAWDNEGLWRVEVRDLKYWLADATVWGRSLQVARDKRFARVKYAYSYESASAGWLVKWTVGAIIQDMLNNMCGALAQDTPAGGIPTPTLLEYFSSTVVDGMKYWYDTGDNHWVSTIFATVDAWVDAVTAIASTSPWKDLTLKPYGVQFEANIVAGAIDQLMRRYYPGWTWWVDPVTLVPAPLNVYGADPTTANTFYVESKQHRVLLEGLKRTLEGCWSRVIVQGQNAGARESAGTSYIPGFIIADEASINMSGTQEYWVRYSGVYVFSVSCNGYDKETQKVLIVRSMTGAFSSLPQTTKNGWDPISWESGQSVCRKDAVWLHDTGYAGTAYSVMDLYRTLALIDETVGSNVLSMSSDGAWTTVDRGTSKEGQALAEQVLERVQDVRYSGRMVVRGGPVFCPNTRVQIDNTEYGSIVAVPQSVTWRLSTGEREYQLGDNEYNPFEELKLLNELKWRNDLAKQGKFVRA